MKRTELLNAIENRKARSAWDKGVKLYAYELVEYLDMEDITDRAELRKALLNGASDWAQYSYGGCSLICNVDIAERLCSPSEFKKCNYGEWKPNRCEEWLDVQARALRQAANVVMKCFA